MTKPLAPTHEIGYAQPPSYQWWAYQNETTPELMWPQSISVYDTMRRTDSQVTSVLRAMTLPVRRTTWRIDPNGARDEVVRFVADDLGLPIVGKNPTAPPRTKDRFSWADHLRLALLMLPFGHMIFEQTYRVDPDGGRAHLRKLGPRMPSTIEFFDVAPDGGLRSITQYWTNLDAPQVPIPVDRLVAYVHEKEGGNWIGQSILRPAYKNWLLKDRLLRVQARTIERNGMGIPRYTGAEGETPEAQAAGLAMAKAWRSGEEAGSAIPFGAQLDLVGVSGTLPDAEPVVRYHDEQIGRAVLAHFLNLGTQTGSWALGTTFADFFTMSLQTLAEQVADVATQHIVEDLVDVNWGTEEPAPKIVFDEIGSRQAATAASIRSLVDAGIIEPDAVLEESTRQQYGLPPKDPNTNRVQDQQATDTGAQPFYASAGAEPDSFTPWVDEYDELDEDELGEALIVALAEFTGEVLAADWDPRLHPRDRAGRFRNVVDRILHALDQWSKGNGPNDPLPESVFTRAHVRKAALHRGIPLKRGETRERIVELLKDDVRAHVRGQRDAKAEAPNKAKFTLQSGTRKGQDVAVYRDPQGKPALYRENDAGQRGRLVKKFDSLDDMAQWADDNGEPRVAEWARTEAGGKSAPVPAKKAAPKKAATPSLPSGADIEAVQSARDLRPVQIMQGHNLTPAGQRALDSLGPAGHPRIAAIPDTEGKIREAYRMLGAPGGGQDSYVALIDVRKLLGEQVPRSEVDDTLRRMAGMPDVMVTQQAYGRHNAAERIPAAVMIGGQENDLLHIDEPTLARPSQFRAVDMAQELVNRRDGGPRHPLMVNLSDADLRAEVDRRITDPITARDVAAEVPGYSSPAGPSSPALSLYSPSEASKLRDSLGLDMSVPESQGMLDAEARRRVETVLDDVDEMLAGDASDKALLNRLEGRRKLGAPASVVDELTVAVRQDEVENRIRAAYADLAGDRGGFVSVTALRERLGDTPRAEVDDALRRMSRGGGTHLAPQDYGSMRTPDDDAAAITIGGRQNHLIQVDDPSPRRDRVRQVSADIRGRLGEAPAATSAPRKPTAKSMTKLAAARRDLAMRLADEHSGPNEGVLSQDLWASEGDPAKLRRLADGYDANATEYETQAATADTAERAARLSATAAERRRQAAVLRAAADESDRLAAPSPAPANDGLDEMDDRRLRSWAREFEIPGADTKTPAQLRQALRQQGIGGPDVEHAKRLAEIEAEQGSPEQRIEKATTAIVDAYSRLVRKPGDYVKLAELRRELGPGHSRADVDEALLRLSRMRNRNVIAESPAVLTDADRAAAVTIGGRRLHAIGMEDVGPRRRAVSEAEVASATSAIEAAYRRAPKGGAGWVKLADLRRELGDTDRDAVDEALKRLSRMRGVDVIGELNQKTLTAADRKAAVVIGGQDRHLINIEPGADLSSLLPSPAPAKKAPGRAAAKVAGLKAAHADLVASIRGGASEQEIIQKLAADKSLTAAKLRTLAADLDIDVPADMRAKSSIQLHIAEQASRRYGGAPIPTGAPRKTAPAKAGRPPATPASIRDLFDSDDATIKAALKDVFEGKFGPYTTKAEVSIRRAGTRIDKKGREHKVDPSIGIGGKIYDADGNEIGYFGRNIGPVDLHYQDGTVRREIWAQHKIVQLGEGDYDENPTRYHGKGFGGEFNQRAIQWYRDSGVHGISQSDHNGYVWASQGFNFGGGGRVPDYLVEDIRGLIADLRAGKRTSTHTADKYSTIPKRFRDAPDVNAQIAAAEALLARLNTTKPGEPGYPTAYEISQLGRRPGQRGKTAVWLGKLLWVSADEMVLNPDEGEVISQ